MAQQINLLSPLLLKPQRHFSALTMAQSLAVLLLAGLLLGLYLLNQAGPARREAQLSLDLMNSEQQRLLQAIGRLPTVGDGKALQERLASVEQQVQHNGQLLSVLEGDLPSPGRSHSDLLLLMARSVPQAVWLTELNWRHGRLELQGGTLDPAALRAWIGQLNAEVLFAGQELSLLQLERLGTNRNNASPYASSLKLPAGLPLASQPVWAFHLISEQGTAIAPASGGGGS